MKKWIFLLCFLSAGIYSFSNNDLAGHWRGTLQLNDSIQLPFQFEISTKTFKIINQGDELITSDIVIKEDSSVIKLAVFGTELHFANSDTELKGYFVNTTKLIPVYVPFKATRDSYRFYDKPEKASANFTGKYDVYFKNEDEESKHGVAIFNQSGNYISGTFLTNTGDYRFLEGDVSGNKMFVAAFDGSHLFYLSAELKNDSLFNGTYYSSVSWFDEWSGRKNPDAALSTPDQIIKYDRSPVHFAFQNSDGKIISNDDPRFSGKPMIIQFMGSWCPNCMDETKFLAEWYSSSDFKEIELIALDFERHTDTAKIFSAIKRIESQLHIHYPVLYAGSSDKKKAVKAIPQLDRLVAFPTMIFLNRNKEIVATHTGFNGPATGEEYEKFKKWFNKLTEKLKK